MIIYATAADADLIREWINGEDSIAWIVEAARSHRTYTWKAVDRLDAIQSQDYCLWHKSSYQIKIPSGRRDIPDSSVQDPYAGWEQTLDHHDATTPWFGGNLPAPCVFTFKEHGRSCSEALGRSGFAWAGDHFRLVGLPAPPGAKQWWHRLRRFIIANSVRLRWPQDHPSSRRYAFALPDAHEQIRSGRPRDDNP